MVRKRGFEPRRSCDRQPLKLVRLPVPPLPQTEYGYGPAGAGVAGVVGAGAAGAAGAAGVAAAGGVAVAGVPAAGGVAAGCAGGGGAGVPLTTDPVSRRPMIAKLSANSMNSTAAIAVALLLTVAPALAPNAA